MNIKRAVKTDVGELMRLDALCFPQQPMTDTYFYEAIDFFAYELFVATLLQSGQPSGLAGFATICVHQNAPKTMQLANICVDPACQKNGVGAALMLISVESAKKADFRLMELFVFPDNARAISLYKRFEFSIVEKVPDYYGAGSDRLKMRLIL